MSSAEQNAKKIKQSKVQSDKFCPICGKKLLDSDYHWFSPDYREYPTAESYKQLNKTRKSSTNILNCFYNQLSDSLLKSNRKNTILENINSIPEKWLDGFYTYNCSKKDCGSFGLVCFSRDYKAESKSEEDICDICGRNGDNFNINYIDLEKLESDTVFLNNIQNLLFNFTKRYEEGRIDKEVISNWINTAKKSLGANILIYKICASCGSFHFEWGRITHEQNNPELIEMLLSLGNKFNGDFYLENVQDIETKKSLYSNLVVKFHYETMKKRMEPVTVKNIFIAESGIEKKSIPYTLLSSEKGLEITIQFFNFNDLVDFIQKLLK